MAVSTRASQLRKRFAKLRGRATGNSSERAIEIRHRLKAAGESSFANARVRIEQKRLRFLYSDSREVIDETYPGRFLEHLAKVIAVLLIIPCDAVRLTTLAGRTTARF